LDFKDTFTVLAFHFLHYKIMMDPAYGLEVLNDLWAKEPAGMLSICLTLVGLLLTLTFKVLDIFWDMHKEHSRQGKLRIELETDVDLQGMAVLWAIISNAGKEPLVLRDIGYAKSRLFGKKGFVPVTPVETPLPRALNARDMIRIPVTDDVADLSLLAESFRVKDSMGKIWEASDSETRRARRRLKGLRTARGRQTQVAANRQSLLEKLETSPPLTTQN
jgi:hypothetical protein